MLHDLFKNFVENVYMAVSKDEVCDLKDNTFYAKIYFVSDENIFNIDARPSDAIAIALRFDAPIYVADKIFDQSLMVEGDYEVLNKSEEGKKWAEYLENLSPEDFGKYKI